jgi:hypothetical protein
MKRDRPLHRIGVRLQLRTATALPQRTQRRRGTQRTAHRKRRPATSPVLFWDCRSGSHEQLPEWQFPQKISARCGTDSLRMSSPLRLRVPLRPLRPSCSLRFCISAVKAVHSCSLVHAKRFNRADPFNPSNPCARMLMPTSRTTSRAPADPSHYSRSTEPPSIHGRTPRTRAIGRTAQREIKRQRMRRAFVTVGYRQM